MATRTIRRSGIDRPYAEARSAASAEPAGDRPAAAVRSAGDRAELLHQRHHVGDAPVLVRDAVAVEAACGLSSRVTEWSIVRFFSGSRRQSRAGR
ncbi:MAG TPA: hypothetical protein PKD63_01500, partial [Solirubrobacteraceae bacterium]|nr:hypothetical protein [Solirubrobacteraceae bacterium]